MNYLEDELLIGTANALQSYGWDLQPRQSVDLTSNNATLKSCADLNYSPENCNNFIKVIEPIPNSDRILVCGTNSYTPKCTLHQKNNLTIFNKLSGGNNEDQGYCPHSVNDFIVSLVTSDKRFFSATRFMLNSARTTIGMSPNPVLGDNRFAVSVSASRDNEKLNLPIRYISAHEHGNYVYFFVTESALELVRDANDRSSKPEYARAIRICKTDNGIGQENLALNPFHTFQKARMECKVVGSYAYFYNNLKSTFLGSEMGTPVLYGTFNSPSNGPRGGAVCKFSFSPSEPGSLSNVFEDGNYNHRTMEGNKYVWTKTSDVPPVMCTNQTSGNAFPFPLVFNPVTSVPSADRPLFVTEGENLDKIAAETVTFEGVDQEVLYYSNQLGQIKQVVLKSGLSFTHNILMETETKKNGNMEEVQKLILRSETDNTRSLYVSRGNKIMQIYKGRCDQYNGCNECLGSRDPYCVWDSEKISCVNMLTQSNLSVFNHSFSASESDILEVCGAVPSNPPTSPTTGDSGKINTPAVEELNPILASTKVSPFIIVGASVGAFVVGLSMGIIVCLSMMCKTYIASKSKSDKVQDDCTTSNATTNADVEMGLEQKKSFNNKSTMTSEKHIIPPNKLNLSQSSVPRYVQCTPQSLQQAPPNVNSSTNTPANIDDGNISMPKEKIMAMGSSNTLPMHKPSNSKEEKTFNFSIDDESEDSAFGDTVPPLKSFYSINSMQNSLKRNRVEEGSYGVSRKQIPNHKVPRGRTSSTVWLRTSVSSDISPLQSPISDV